ncbi:MAG: M1 family metallopeptidase [Amphiplicatus sp.]
MGVERHSSTFIKAGLVLASSALLLACSDEPDPAVMDTGLPLTEGLKAYDVDRYVLDHEILPEKKAIAGASTIEFTAAEPMTRLELDFDGRFKVESVEAAGAELTFEKTPTKLYVDLAAPLQPGESAAVTVRYHGKPVEAERAPWDGGFVWSKSPSGKPWIATAFQGEGCDVWFPCKDHPLGEPRKGAEFFYTVPAGLTAAGNGVLQGVEDLPDGRRKFHWKTELSTNIYGIALNVGPYVLIEDEYQSVNGTVIPLKFWALEEREKEARNLFDKEFAQTVAFFERRLGPYPWGQEKLGVVETPHKGMEHQTINAYGNEYERGAGGYDDLFQHELAHEWFGNMLSVKNNADLWLHEGTGSYMQPVYTQEILGDAARHAQQYRSYLGTRNCVPVARRGEFSEDQTYNAKDGGPGGDIYAKGSLALHTLRYLVGEDNFWTALRVLLYDTPHPDMVEAPIEARFRTTDDFVAIASDVSDQDLGWFFEVYIRTAELPELSVEKQGDDLRLTWKAPNDLPFPMPVPVRIDGEIVRVEMPDGTALIEGGALADVQIDPMLDVLKRLPSLRTCAEREAEDEKAEAKTGGFKGAVIKFVSKRL